MANYKATKKKQYKIFEAIDLQEAEVVAATFGTGWVVAPTTEPKPNVSKEEALIQDEGFCKSIIMNLTIYNRESWPLDKSQAKIQQKKFDEFIKDLTRCDIQLSSEDLQDIAVDEFLTQEKKIEYQSLITAYLTQ